MNKNVDYLSRLGSEHDLNFSSHEILTKHIMGLDGIRRKILVLNTNGDAPGIYKIIDLNEVKDCSIIKQYGNIRRGELRTKPLEEHLQSLLLNFSLKKRSDPVRIVFYDHLQNDISELRSLEAKARNWKTLISKLRTHLKEKFINRKTGSL